MRAQSIVRLALWLGASLFVAACSGKNIIDLNDQLIQAQQQKTLIERQGASSSDEMAVKLTQVSDQLAKIGDEAYAEAARSADPRAKIANYRIAATAYWQSRGDPALAAAQGAWGVRVHDVRASADAVRTAAAWVGAHAPGEPVSEDVLP